ncbi:two component transcriptional regulator, LuxR family [Salimicrobium flavidum]|uniref:Two component transcriptional regulator, LuxR family n=2 Tax=Salimicrobium flavidum TaxID=570947 RepID=A0A1N7KWC8_9BACI|nr:two component transcriptional regulator, LuxR family [Salimicrobium flavidum]
MKSLLPHGLGTKAILFSFYLKSHRKVISIMKPIRLLIADDHAIVRDGFHTILSGQPGFEVVALAKNGEEAWERLEKHKPEIAILDWDMPGKNGIEVMEEALEKELPSSFLILSSYQDDQLALEALKKGANGFLLKDWETEDIIQTVKDCAKGKLIFPASMGPALRRSMIFKKRKTFFSLSEPEEEVLMCIAEGMKNKEIAETLYLSEGTIRNYTSSIYKKLGVKTRSEASSLYKALHH